MRSTILLLVLLVCAVLLVDAAVFAMGLTLDGEFPDLVVLMMFALGESQVGLLAAYVVFGGGRPLFRSLPLVAGIVLWSWPLSLRSGLEATEWCFYFVVLAAIVVGLLAMARLWGVRLCRASEAYDPTRRGREPINWQFSLRRIMGWTAVVAAVLAARQLISVPFEFLVEIPFYVVSNVMLTVLAVWAVLGTRRLRWTLPTAALLGIPLSTALMQIESAGIWPMAAMSTMEFVLAALMLAVVRIAGYRLVRLKAQPAAEPLDALSENGTVAVVESADA